MAATTAAALCVGGVAVAAYAEAAAATYTQLDLSVEVSGTSVTATTTVRASTPTAARYYGVCVRSASDGNLDFDKTAATIATAGTRYTSPPKTFPTGTFTYFSCLYADGAWSNVGAVKTFTVGGPAPSTGPAVTGVTATTATLTWTAVPGATGYLVGRDGRDSTGTGPWSTTTAATTRSITFDRLITGTRYTLFVEAQPGGARRTITVTPSATPTPTPTPSPTPTATPTTPPPPPPPGGSAAVRILGTPRSGLPWHSGAWVGGRFTTASIDAFGTWRGRPTDMVTTYAERSSYEVMASNSWAITTWNGFQGHLNVGLPMITDDGQGSFATIAAGNHDAAWRGVATNLVANGRGDSVVRVGWESNLRDWRWQATAANAAQYKAAFRHIVQVMRAAAPGLRFEFGVACGSGLSGSTDRLAPLTAVYPGDDVVDLVGCDIYDWWNTHATTDAQFASNVARNSAGPGVQDVADFARTHGKGASYGEWGLAKNQNGNNGGGDNAFFVDAMYRFFTANKDVVVFENYFDEPDPYIGNSIQTGQNPNAGARYRALW